MRIDSGIFSPRRSKNILVYNCTTGGINPFHWGEVGMMVWLFFSYTHCGNSVLQRKLKAAPPNVEPRL